ncbi:hypothetical protein MNBD_GAMMA09-1530 [hydrothermal vent metagenome]|uniref:Bacterial virulence factor lipase N-terminal domain-containing protein n=1 Tax=hydrothermal vent metagenome TaxID=652676 RepID=A0A3B0WZ36_9ZZZZ
MQLTKIILAAAVGITLAACSDKDTALQDSLGPDSTVDTISNLDFGNNVIPFPNNILFQGTADGTLNIPVLDAADLTDPKVAMNAQDGFSTVAPISTGFTGAIDDASFPTAVRMYEVTTDAATGVVLTVDRALAYGTEFAAALSSVDTTNSTMAILPLQPLAPKQAYMLVITNDLKSASGRPVGISGSYSLTHGTNPLHTGGVSNTPLLTDAQAQQLEPLRQATVAAETALNAFDSTASSNIIISWNFKTQSIGDVLNAVKTLVGTPATSASASTVDLDGPGPLPPGMAGANSLMFEGTIDVPYYLNEPSNVNDDTVLDSAWKALNPAFLGDTEKNLTQFNPLPAATNAALTIPMLLTLPVSGTAPFPVVIFQHGITSDRTALLGIADKLAAAGFAAIAIDMPMHGVAPGTAFYSSNNERTFDLDLVTQDANGNIIAPVKDGVTDSSGRHYINLTNLLNTRDNLRQSVADLFALRAAIATINVNGGDTDLDATNVYFLGHSLGAMVGTVFTALEAATDVKDAVLAFSGTSVAKILDGSSTFGPSITAGLSQSGVTKGTSDYEAFLGAAQTVVDSADPVNYTTAAATGRGVLLFEIVGGNSSPSDLVVPNRVPDANDSTGTVPAPLAGTDPQIALMGLVQVDSTQSGTNLHLVTKYTSGDHRSILDSSADLAVTTEMQSQTVSFFVNDGDGLTVGDASVLQAPPAP